MRKVLVLLMICLLPSMLMAEDTASSISFSGGSSSLSLSEGRRHVQLSDGAHVDVDGLVIEADEILLEGDNYDRISCTGSILVEDEGRGLTIRTSSLVYDRQDERLVIPAWCEIIDGSNELIATASALRYDMAGEVLELEMDVRLVKNTSDGILSAKAERVSFDRASSTLVMSGGAEVTWRDDTYRALVITMDTGEERISLSGQIGGTVHG